MISLLEFRHELHKHPELSGREKMTARRIREILEGTMPDLLVSGVGGHGVVAVFDSGNPGPVVLFRADMDALPIGEKADFPHASVNPGVSHKCGHDGHTAILAGFAEYVSECRPKRGKLILVFQPAEETGRGAKAMLEHRAMKSLKPNYSFALHNLPGYPEDSVVVRTGTFAAASKGMVIRLKGKTSHASEPEKGKSPASVMAGLMVDLPRLSGNGNTGDYDDYVLLTLIHGNLGTPAFGTSPGDAVLMVTLRAYLDADMEKLSAGATALVKSRSEAAGLTYDIDFQEEFPASVNHPEAVELITRTCEKLDLSLVEAVLPFRWSEDFAHFTAISRAALFGLGAGENHPALHNPDYDFPDRLLERGVQIWKSLYHQLLDG
ncbi:MAG TPA: amidohydrolase [Lentimicrobium sp.]|jgi:amidohydrolase|nr:amidohydrolase [Lentimicrobium sp.]